MQRSITVPDLVTVSVLELVTCIAPPLLVTVLRRNAQPSTNTLALADKKQAPPSVAVLL